MLKCPLWNCVSNKNNMYIGLSPMTLSRRRTMHLNDSSSIALHLKTHSIPKSKFQKILVENTTITAHKINKLQLKILKALHIKTKKNRINRINFENSNNILKYFLSFFFLFSIFLDNILFLLIAFCFKSIWCHWHLSFIQLCVYIIL